MKKLVYLIKIKRLLIQFLLPLTFIFVFQNGFSQMTYVPDDNFEQTLIDLGYDSGPLNDSVPTANIKEVKELDVSNKNVSDLTGIEDFLALESLSCYSNHLTDLDVSQNTALNILWCGSNQLTSLDVTQNAVLKGLDFSDNRLTNIDVTKNTVLNGLVCKGNQLTQLDVTQNTALTWLDCLSNQLTSLNITRNTKLTELYCNYNLLTSLDVTQNTALTWLYCIGNQLTSLDVTQNKGLNGLQCAGNQLTSLDVSKNTALNTLVCGSNQITNLDVTQNPSLLYLHCENNNLTFESLEPAMSITNFTYSPQNSVGIVQNITKSEGEDYSYILTVGGSSNQYQWYKDGVILPIQTSSILSLPNLTKTDAGVYTCEVTNTVVTGLTLYSKEITLTVNEIVSGMTYVPDDYFEQKLIYLGYDSGELNDSVPTANIAGVKKLIIIDNTRLTDLTGIEDFTALETLICENNFLTSLDLSKNTALTSLDCGWNPIKNLDVSQNTKLEFLACFGNQLTSLDVSNNTALTSLYCYSNQLTSLDVSNNTALTRIHCYSNQLTSLDLSQNPNLTQIECYENNLTELNLKNANNSILTKLNTTENPDLVCIEVDNAEISPSYSSWTKDATTRYSEDCNSNSNVGCTYEISEWYYHFDGSGGTDSVEVTCAETCELTANPLCDWIKIVSAENRMGSGKVVFSVEPNSSGSSRECYISVGSENDTLNIIQDARSPGNLMTYVPDDNFEQALIDLGYDSGELNDSVPTNAIDTVKSLVIWATPVKDLTGIEDFTNLEELICSWTYISALDVSKNLNLKNLNCDTNQLTSLKLNDGLEELHCGSNQLTSLDINNTSLKYLQCGGNQLSSLNVSNNPDLEFIGCSGGNQLTSINLKNNTNLIELNCDNNSLKYLDLSENVAIERIFCENNKLMSLDLSSNSVLRELFCSKNQLTSLNLSQNPLLEALYCNSNDLTELDIKNGNNGILTTLNVLDNPNLTCIQVDNAEYATSIFKRKDPTASFSESCSDCTSKVPQRFYYLEAVGGSDSVEVATSDGCGWTANPLCDWVKITEGESGTGNGKIVFSVEENLSDSERECFVTVVNDTFNIIQQGTVLLNDEAEILRFNIDGQEGETVIGNGVVFLTMPYNTSLSALTPQIEVSEGASISPSSGIETDFSSAVKYVVTAENKLTTKDWDVYIDHGPMINSNDSIVINELYDLYSELPDKLEADTLVTVIGNHVTELNLSNLGLTGTVSALFSDLDSLRRLDLSHNNLSGALPEIFGEINKGLKDALLENKLTLDYLNLSYNRFLFCDLEGVWDKIRQITEFSYQPQAKLTNDVDTTLLLNSSFRIDIPGYSSGEFDQIKWFKEGKEINGEIDTSIAFQNITYSDSGTYHCEITNTLIPGLTLKSGNMNIHVINATDVSQLNQTGIKVYPNPTTGKINIEGFDSDQEVDISVFDNRGRLIHHELVISDKTSLDIRNQPSGIYILVLNGNRTETYKIVKE